VSDPTRVHPDHSFPTADPSSPADTRSVGEATNDPDSSSAQPISANLPSGPSGYELLDEIGRGGMGIVYRGRDVALSRDVAVKLLQDRYALTSLVARRFVDEAKITGQLQHPGIPPVHEVGELPDGRPFLVMKLIKGRTLADLIADGSENRGSLIAVFEQVCQAVAYAHNHGVVHRDLKPANVMVGAFGEVQVMDWGSPSFGSRLARIQRKLQLPPRFTTRGLMLTKTFTRTRDRSWAPRRTCRRSRPSARSIRSMSGRTCLASAQRCARS
jgi:serine/threonine protein kinase